MPNPTEDRGAIAPPTSPETYVASTESTIVASSPRKSWLARRWIGLKQGLSAFNPGDTPVFDVALGFALLFTWFTLFCVGYSISSAPLIARVNSPETGLARGFMLLLQIVSIFAVSNVGLLSLCSALVGAIARRLSDDEARKKPRTSPYFHAVVGAFLIFLVSTGGTYALLGVGFSPPPPPPKGPDAVAAVDPEVAQAAVERAQEHYKNLAAFTSIICLIEGFSPFALNAVSKRFTGKNL